MYTYIVWFATYVSQRSLEHISRKWRFAIHIALKEWKREIIAKELKEIEKKVFLQLQIFNSNLSPC